jgi:hypothetical protein
MNATLKFTANIEKKPDHLLLAYQVANADSRDVYLLNRLFRTLPEWKMTPDVVYVHFLTETKTVWLSKKLADIPQGVRITAPVAPFVTPVRAGATFREEVHIPLPVHEYRQYGGEAQVALKEAASQVYRQVYFTLGYYWRPPGTTEEPGVVNETPVIMPRTPFGQPLEFAQLQTDPKRLDIPVMLAVAPPKP